MHEMSVTKHVELLHVVATKCYDLTPCYTIIQMFSSDFRMLAYCKGWDPFTVRYVHISCVHTFDTCFRGRARARHTSYRVFDI
jgi:hypothetical protein